MQVGQTPDELELREHLSRGSFESEIERKWSEPKVKWPHLFISVFARHIEGAPKQYWFRFDCTNYPADPPIGVPWDISIDQPLAPSLWPGGNIVVTGVFRPTEWRADALYLPCDRIAVTTHDASWVATGPAHLRWTRNSDITLYLNEIHSIINSTGYTGPRGA